jgi:iron complex outermembrane recepter protein
MSRKLLALECSVLALTLACGRCDAAAQEALPPIDVGAERQSAGSAVGTSSQSDAAPPFTAGGGSLVAPSIPAVRAELQKTVGSTGFVDANAPEQQTRYVADLHDALKDTPGVFTESRYGQELRISMRGSNLTRDYHVRGVELLQDGIPLTFADGAGDAYSVDPHYYRAIEVYKGGNGLAYGASTLGGAINFVSPTAYTAVSPNYWNVEGGSYDTIRGQGQMSRVFGDFDILLNGSYNYSLGYRGHEQSRYLMFNGNAGYRFSNQIETRFYFGLSDTGQQLPGTLYLDQALTAPWTSVAPFIASPYQLGFSGNQGRYQQNYRIANKTTIDLGFGQLDVNSWFVGQYLYHPIFVVLQQDTSNWGAAPRFASTQEIGGHKNEVIAGGRFWGESGTDKWFTNFNGMEINPFGPSGIPNVFNQFFNTAFPPGSWNALSQLGFVNTCNGGLSFPSGNFICPGYVDVGGNPQLRNNVFGAFNAEAYFEDRFHLTPNLIAMAGLKYLSDQRSSAALGGIAFEPIAGHDSRTYHGLIPKFGLMYQPTPDIQIFADGSMSRDVPDTTDLTQSVFPPRPPWIANPDGTFGYRMNPLKAQKAWTAEVGSRGKWDRFSWDATYYYAHVWDELLKFNPDPGSGIYSVTVNAPNTVHQGIELSAGVDLFRDLRGPDAGDVLKLTQLWNLNLYAFDHDPVYGNNWLPVIPRNVLRSTLSYSTKDGFYLAPSVDWVPTGAYVDYANTLRAPGYALIGFQAGLKLPNGMEWYVDARNLGNVHYVSDITSVANARNPLPNTYAPGNPQAFYPGNGASIFSGVKLRF